jgi:hypothetical protein
VLFPAGICWLKHARSQLLHALSFALSHNTCSNAKNPPGKPKNDTPPSALTRWRMCETLPDKQSLEVTQGN